MYSAIQCLYNLSSVDLSVEILPPKSERDFVGIIGGRLVVLPRLVSFACGAVPAASELNATPRALARLVRIDESFRTLQMAARERARLGVSKLLFLRGGCYVSRQFELDLISSPRQARCLSLFCVTTRYHKTHSLSASARLG